MKMRLLWLALPVVFTGVCRAAVADLALAEQTLPGLEPILRGAVQQSPRMVSRAVDLEIAEQNRIATRAGLLPNIGGYVQMTESRDDRADLSAAVNVSKTYYNFSITQPLFFWGERRNTARIGQIQKAMAERNYREGYRQLAQELRQKYLGLIIQKTAVARAKRFLVYAERERELAEDRLKKGQISDLQIYSIRVQAESAQIAFERAEWDFANQKHSFARLAGIGQISDEQIPDEVPMLRYNADAVPPLLATYLSAENSPSTESANMRDQLKIEHYNLANQKTRLRPKFNLVAGSSQDEQAYTANIAQKYRVQSLFGGVSASWTVFDGFAAQAGKRTSMLRLRQLERDYEELKDRLSEQAQSQAKLIGFAARSMAITDQALGGAVGGLKARREEYARGTASETAVAQAELNVFDMQIGAFQNRISFLNSIAEFLGTLNQDPVSAHLPSNK